MGRWHTKRVASALQLGLCENCLSIWCCLPLVRSLFLVYKRTASDPKQFKRCVQPQRQPFKNHCQSPSWNSGQNLGTDAGRGLSPGNGDSTPRRWSRYGTTHCPRDGGVDMRPPTVCCGSSSYTQLLWGWMSWYRCGE